MKYFRQLMEEATDGVVDSGMGSADNAQEEVTPSWYYSAPNEEEGFKGIGGNGDTPPEWFKVDKYKSVDEQAKAYADLEKRFGGFTGAPEKYEIPEGIDSEDPLLNKFMEISKNSNMSNDTFKEIISTYTEMQQQAVENQMQQAMAKLGENAEQRISNVQNWLNTNAPKEIIEMIEPMATSAESIQALEWLIDKTKGSKVADNNITPQTEMSESEYAEKLMAKDKHGNLKMAVDPEYKKYIDELTARRIS